MLTLTAGEVGFGLVNCCEVTFLPAGDVTPVRGRLMELVQPGSGGGSGERAGEWATTLYVVPVGTKGAVPFSVPTGTPVIVAIDSAPPAARPPAGYPGWQPASQPAVRRAP